MRHRLTLIIPTVTAALAVSALLLISACGGTEGGSLAPPSATDDASRTASKAPKSEAAHKEHDAHSDDARKDAGGEVAAPTLEIRMDDFSFAPSEAKALAGNNEILVANVGAVEHELELFKSDVDPGSLTVKDGTADTAPLGEEVAEFHAEVGETGSVVADLEPGQYAMICNHPGHYEAGMFGKLIVK